MAPLWQCLCEVDDIMLYIVSFAVCVLIVIFASVCWFEYSLTSGSHVHVHVRTCTYMYSVYTYVHTYMYKYMYMYNSPLLYTHTMHSSTHSHSHTYTNTHTHTCIYMYMYTHTHTHTFTLTLTLTHSHTHTHMQCGWSCASEYIRLCRLRGQVLESWGSHCIGQCLSVSPCVHTYIHVYTYKTGVKYSAYAYYNYKKRLCEE